LHFLQQLIQAFWVVLLLLTVVLLPKAIALPPTAELVSLRHEGKSL